VLVTLVITYWAARKTKTSSEYYAAGRSVSARQNGFALAGDYMSAASVLGISGMVALKGYDGMIYATGWLVGWPALMFLMAEPLRNLGKFTFADVVAFRLQQKPVRIAAAIGGIVTVLFYTIAQMVGSGSLIQLMFGLKYEFAEIIVGVVMLAYVLFGGMLATTWVQIIKAVLLLIGVTFLTALTLSKFGFSPVALYAEVVKQHGPGALQPGGLITSPLEAVSLGLALMFGLLGLPHILMRFFTVPTAQAARKSVIWAMAIIGGFYVLTLFMGLGAAMKVGPTNITAIDKGGNMAAPLLAQHLGGGADSMLGNLMLAFVAAVAFATIVAVVAGLVLAAASAMSHDLWVGVIKGDHATSDEEVRAARICSVIVGIMAITIGILAQGQNVAHLVALAFAVAASANLPVVLLTLYWKRCNTAGVVGGLVVGTVTAIGLVLVSPNMTYPKAITSAAQKAVDTATARIAKLEADMGAATEAAAKEKLEKAIAASKKDLAANQATLKKFEGQTTSLVGLEKPLFELRNPGIISIPLGFLAVIVFSLMFKDGRALAMWDELYVRTNTGIGRAGVSH
ncbi:MAG: sodium/solute symporter, partial [Burkholderiales bacterium]|nr:sodium/solute symporter [Burkholderiales bacterium]